MSWRFTSRIHSERVRLSGCKKVKKDVISDLASSYVRVGSGSVNRETPRYLYTFRGARFFGSMVHNLFPEGAVIVV